ncbi:hypothetical protein [Actinomadura harenae]|uniref:hypothetical protein n=1 Tax=Actinomadura harenae TaxID=2483351 RepID=UPI0013153056|nr:hypothetical protein [Actinomadura harenae]
MRESSGCAAWILLEVLLAEGDVEDLWPIGRDGIEVLEAGLGVVVMDGDAGGW